MIRYGFTLSSEEHPPATLVRNARHAEEVGFDFCSISDHFHPWTQAQGHSPFVWSVLGAIAHATDRIAVGTGVTCPIVRSHPTAIAQASATTSLLFEGRFFLGVGTGEALNEHIAGHRWPRPEMRVAMLDEAVAIIRRLWTGDTVDHHGTFYDVDNARLFDPPARAQEIIVSGFGEQSVDLAARIGDGYWGHDPAADKVQRYRERGGTGPCYAQISVCCGPDVDACRATVHRVWPNGGIPGQLAQDLPTWTHFEQAAQLVSVEAATEHVPCGPDLDAILASVDAYRAAGYDHLYFHQIGPDQDAFFQAWESELQKALTER